MIKSEVWNILSKNSVNRARAIKLILCDSA